MNDEVAFTAGIIVGTFVSFIFTLYMAIDFYQDHAVKYNCGEYNKSTGNFQWIKH
jgi:hypothetical protein